MFIRLVNVLLKLKDIDKLWVKVKETNEIVLECDKEATGFFDVRYIQQNNKAIEDTLGLEKARVQNYYTLYHTGWSTNTMFYNL